MRDDVIALKERAEPLCISRHAIAQPVGGQIQRSTFIPRRWVRPTIFDKLMRHAAPHLGLQLHLLVGTGMKPSEMFSLRWADVDLDEGIIGTVNDTVLAIRPHVRNILATLPRERDHVVLTPRGEPYAVKKRAGGQNKSALYPARKAAGHPEINLTHFEHSYVIWHLALHRNFDLLKDQSGWSEYRLRWCRALTDEFLDSVKEELLRLFRNPPAEILSAGLFATPKMGGAHGQR